jgi:hypothetical protein
MADMTLLLNFILAIAELPTNPAIARYAPDKSNAHIELPSSIGEVGETIIHCYHPSGHFKRVDVIEKPWRNAKMYNAEKSALLRIQWNGALLKTPYFMDVALLERGGSVRTAVQSDNAIVPRNPKCSLEQWKAAKS